MKIKFRGYGPATDWKMVEMHHEFPCRINKDDTLRIAGVCYRVSYTEVVINLNECDFIVNIQSDEENAFFNWPRVEQ